MKRRPPFEELSELLNGESVRVSEVIGEPNSVVTGVILEYADGRRVSLSACVVSGTLAALEVDSK